MGKTRGQYSAEFRQQMIAQVRSGQTPEKLAKEFEPTAHTFPDHYLRGTPLIKEPIYLR